MPGCNSHGLQLLIQDLLKNGRVTDVFKKAQAIVDHFNNMPLQLAILRRIQREINSREFALLTVVSTRWGSQYQMLHSAQGCIVVNVHGE